MGEKNKVNDFYKDILPDDVIDEVMRDYDKISEKQQKQIESNKEMIRNNIENMLPVLGFLIA